MYRTMGLAHARLHELRLAGARATRAARRDDGQGTVEYVALILLVAGILAAVVAAKGSFGGNDIGKTIVTKLKESIDGVGDAPGRRG